MKNWREIPGIFLMWAWRLSLGFFLLMSIVHSAVLAVYDKSYGMIEGICIGSSMVFAFIMIVETKARKKEERRNAKVKELMREAYHCQQLATQFEKEGNYQAYGQFVDDYNKKRGQILALLAEEVDPEDIKTEGR